VFGGGGSTFNTTQQHCVECVPRLVVMHDDSDVVHVRGRCCERFMYYSLQWLCRF
jgi:hypothetical protein